MNKFASQLLTHYKKNARKMPWREDITPYKVWLSEIMLQQTTVKTVIPYFEKFTHKFPTVFDLANANEEEIMHLWQGLGYYSRARNLHKCAKVIANDFNGQFPKTEKDLLKLPGIGPYTAAAISSIAFNQKATVLDGNVERVMSRIFKIEKPLPTFKPIYKEKAEELTPNIENDIYSNAIMELGATICTPKKPKCETCPVSNHCTIMQENLNPQDFPKKEPKKAKKVDHGTVYIIENDNGELYLQKRPNKGLLASLWELPSTGWTGESHKFPENMNEILEQSEHVGQIRHVFTHIDLTFDVMHFKGNIEGEIFEKTHLPPLSTLMKKALSVISS
ncbi:MAG: A/G-specific adenine glycosylase [Magnetococcales bacterium]|nr:A/G-specific adenine glycosylase [Magnetococcales bacterium]|tara:strand:- start:507 stop:1508 length:1002 start_codon:yes stop_codon:yes gene_type:complete